MGKSSRSSLALGLILTVNSVGLAQKNSPNQREPISKITVCVYDHARLSSRTWAQAKRAATRIFHQAGVETEWLDLPLSAAEAGAKADADVVHRLGATGFILKILTQPMAERLNIRDAALGYSVPCPEGEPACIANILYHRVEDLATSGNASLAETLGHAMAHEIGHLLLRSHAHSPSGIMQAQWRAKELQRASKGLLLFTPDQAERLRADVLKRVRQQESLQAVGPKSQG